MVELLNKTYDGESIIDMPRDIDEMFSGMTPEMVKAIPNDQYGFALGTFTVTVTWEAD